MIFYGFILFTAYFLHEEVMSVRLYVQEGRLQSWARYLEQDGEIQ